MCTANKQQDPYFAYIEDPKRPGKTKKVKKLIPDYIPEHDAKILASVRKSSYRLDMSLFNLFGIRFGWSSVIGIVPAFGDALDVAIALLIWRKCCGVEGGLDSNTSLHMLINIFIDFFIGLVPFLGDIADAAFKANTKNTRLLEVYLDKKYRPRNGYENDARRGGDPEKRRSNRKSGIYHPQDPPPATIFEDFSDEEDDRRAFVNESRADDHVRQPQATRAPEVRRGGGGGFFSGGRQSSRRQPDTEMSMRQESGSVRR